ncbi:MAG TPA: hypothetical protein VI916_07870 [Acidimicrobiia bacterium]|nr:hypothetical protein [Acidimicrobiia bacterium]
MARRFRGAAYAGDLRVESGDGPIHPLDRVDRLDGLALEPGP